MPSGSRYNVVVASLVVLLSGVGIGALIQSKAVMFPHLSIFATGLVGLSLLIVPSRLICQVPTSDSAVAVGRDSPAAPAETTAAGQDSLAASDSSQAVAGDTGIVRRSADSSFDSAPSDSALGASPDALQRSRSPGTVRSDTTAASTQPRDSILQVACSATAGPAAVARDLLVVVFSSEAGARERAQVARTVEGKLLGPLESEPGAYYLRVPARGQEFKLRAAADELARLPQVRQVGSRACPSPQSPG